MWLRILLVATATIGPIGCAGRPAPADAPDPEVRRGRALYARYCALCHGERGEGHAADQANALASQELLSTATDQFLREAIVRGRPGTPMSAWGEAHGGPLGARDTEAILRLLRSWQTAPSLDVHAARVEGDAERGAPIYGRLCAGCHGARGEGGEAPTLDNPVFHETASDGFIRYAIAQGRSGTPMPAYAGRLEDAAIDDLVAFVRSVRRPPERAAAPPAPLAPAEVVVHPAGPAARLSLRDGMYVPADQVKAALDAGARLVLVDARASSDYLASHIPGAISVPFYAVDDAVARLPRDGTWIVAYCGCPHAASGRVVRALRERGFANTAVLDEGLGVWTERGYPLWRAVERGDR